MRKPFILLDDARDPARAETADARLYEAPSEVFAAYRGEEIAAALCAAESAHRQGKHIAGFIGYETGLALESKLAPRLRAEKGAPPLVWFAAFEGYRTIPAGEVPEWLANNSCRHGGPPRLSPLRPAIDRDAHAAACGEILEAIRAGDIYQANLTFPLDGTWAGDPLAIYAAIRPNAAAGYGAVLFDGERHYLSFSPELFFALRGRTVTLKPMKGTRARGWTPEEDARLVNNLTDSAKDRAENLMITDLMRNDISRLAVPGSVTVRDAFAIETYPTVHQMVSTVRAALRNGQNAIDLLRTIFPCGSITGAPKIRAMELIDEVERYPRHAYCGAIGRVDPDGEAAFNVAIRTLTLAGTGEGPARMGVGSGLVADSDVDDEWAECLVKGEFVAAATSDLRLIETMAFDPKIGVPLIEFHLERLKKSAASLGFFLDRHALRNEVQAFCFLNREPRKLRVLLSQDGTWEIEGSDMPDPLREPVAVSVLPLPVAQGDWRLRHKTTDRAFYDEARKQVDESRAQEVVFARSDGLLTEGSFTNVFVERGGVLLTPPVSLGLLPGVLRASLIDDGRAREAELTQDDLADGFLIGNALRGLMPARLIAQD